MRYYFMAFLSNLHHTTRAEGTQYSEKASETQPGLEAQHKTSGTVTICKCEASVKHLNKKKSKTISNNLHLCMEAYSRQNSCNTVRAIGTRFILSFGKGLKINQDTYGERKVLLILISFSIQFTGCVSTRGVRTGLKNRISRPLISASAPTYSLSLQTLISLSQHSQQCFMISHI